MFSSANAISLYNKNKKCILHYYDKNELCFSYSMF